MPVIFSGANTSVMFETLAGVVMVAVMFSAIVISFVILLVIFVVAGSNENVTTRVFVSMSIIHMLDPPLMNCLVFFVNSCVVSPLIINLALLVAS